ncbi:hypothetical protein L2E82_50684 [Cichorium intybus]|nr:hypothetical protein L2E82_50684 [Cichorium intybus]
MISGIHTISNTTKTTTTSLAVKSSYSKMSYHSKPKTDLAMIGAEAFALLDDNFPRGQNLKRPLTASTAPPRRNPPHVFPCQYKPQQAYFVQQVPAERTEMVIDSYQAVNVYGGTMLVDYPKRKPTRKGFFF